MKAKSKKNRDSISDTEMVSFAEIKPHPENERLYKPVDANDKDVRALADDIRAKGVLEPLVLTSDYYILSGHRRSMAARIAGLTEVPCRVNRDTRSDDPDILDKLASHNLQRVKKTEEMIREEVVLADPEDAYQRLLHHRYQSSLIDTADCIQLGEKKKRPVSSKGKIPMLDAIQRVLESYRDFLPLTDRQIHYALLNDPPLKHASKPHSRYINEKRSYKNLTKLLTQARQEGKIPFERIHDPTRPMTNWTVFDSVAPFVRKEMNGFLKSYGRNLLQTQPNHIEIVGEKNTIETIVRRVAFEYGVPYMIGRGYSSLYPRYKMAQRYKKSGKEKLILHFVSDFDPEGENITESFARSMRDEFGVQNIHPVKVALTFKQVQEMRLPEGPQAKSKSPRTKQFVKKYGKNVWELEALAPDRLQAILHDAIVKVLDIDAFNAEREREKQDAAKLESVRISMRRNLIHKHFAGGHGDEN